MRVFAFATVAATYALILIGGVVHGTGSSLACPDWPTCYGSLMPEMTGGVAVEHSHRLAAGAVSLMTIGMAVWLTGARRRLPGLWKAAWGAVALVLAQAVLGGVTVLMRLPTTVSTFHTATAMLFFLALLSLAFRVHATARPPAILPDGARRRALVAAIATLFQIVLGGLVRHSGAALQCLDVPLCRGSLWPDAYVVVHVHVVHRMGALVVAALVLASSITTWRASRGQIWRRAIAVALPLLVGLQIYLGVRSIDTFLDLMTVQLHLAVGVLILAGQWSLVLATARGPADEVVPAGAPRRASSLQIARDLLTLTKPRITGLVIATFAGGVWLAPGSTATWQLAMSLLGTVLIVSAANVLNMYKERAADALMERTRGRPLPSGRLHPEAALALGALCACAATPLLFLGGNGLTGLLGLGAFAVYVFVYTPMKARTAAALFVGAVPGAMPPLMGWTSVTGRIDAGGLALFAILFLWQIPHFLAIALFRAEDYARASFRIFPAAAGPRTTRIAIVGFSVALVASTIVLAPLRIVGGPFLAAAIILGAAFVGWGLAGFRRVVAPERWARSLFVASIVYLALIFAALIVDRGAI